MPAGSLTLRVFTGEAADNYVLCLNPECGPGEEDCGYRKGGLPIWPYHKVGWLAEILGASEEVLPA